ncbi:hypothetical protein DDW11_03010 [Sulfolobus sp. SCGC AB-777_G06]|nr:hypothetical protein DDW11_03010 [Sulfolobus sp. SCGC AB-777_G06]
MFNFLLPIDLELLRKLLDQVEMEEEKIGISMAIEGIENKLPPKKFRERLKEIIEKSRNMYYERQQSRN